MLKRIISSLSRLRAATGRRRIAGNQKALIGSARLVIAASTSKWNRAKIVRDDDFEWDDVKALENAVKHKVTFEMARDVFDDSCKTEWEDDNREEVRYNMLGMVDGRILHVTFTYRENRTRIISARLAERHERRRYHEG